MVTSYPAMRTISARAAGSLRSPTSWVADVGVYALWVLTAIELTLFGVATVLTAGLAIVFLPVVAVIAVGAVLACRDRPHCFWGALLIPAGAIPAAAFVMWRASRTSECDVQGSCTRGHPCVETTVCTHSSPPPGNVAAYLAICATLTALSIGLFLVAGRRSKRRLRHDLRSAG